MNIQMLKGKIVERGLNLYSVSSKMGLSRASLYRKLRGGEKITIGEAAKIRDVLNLSEEEATAIFFN